MLEAEEMIDDSEITSTPKEEIKAEQLSVVSASPTKKASVFD